MIILLKNKRIIANFFNFNEWRLLHSAGQLGQVRLNFHFPTQPIDVPII